MEFLKKSFVKWNCINIWNSNSIRFSKGKIWIYRLNGHQGQRTCDDQLKRYILVKLADVKDKGKILRVSKPKFQIGYKRKRIRLATDLSKTRYKVTNHWSSIFIKRQETSTISGLTSSQAAFEYQSYWKTFLNM